MSRSEIAKAARSTGAASGGFLSRRRSQARNSSGLSRSAAFRPAWKNRSRCDGVSRTHARHRGLKQINAPHFSCLSKARLSKRNYKNEKRKYAESLPWRGPPGS